MSLMPQYLLPGNSQRERLDSLQERLNSLLAQRGDLAAAPRGPVEVEDFFKTAIPYSGLRAAAKSATRDPEEGFAQAVNHLAEPLSYADLRWLFGKEADAAMRQRIAEITETSGRSPIDMASRRSALKSLDAQIDELAVEEEREVLALNQAGYRVLRRANVDAELLLRVWNERAVTAPGPSDVLQEE